MDKNSLLILLVGANPLPNYLAAWALRPSKIALAYTKETAVAKDRLKTELKKVLGAAVGFVDPDPFVEDATCATTVQRVVRDILDSNKGSGDASTEFWLNYTGGTKVMAVHARTEFSARFPDRLDLASYLDEGEKGQQPRLRFDDGNSTELAEYDRIPLSLETILRLHGISHTPRTAKKPAPTKEDAEEILGKVLSNLPLARNLHCERKRLQDFTNPKKAVHVPFNSKRYGLTLSQPQFPTEALLNSLSDARSRKSWYEQWCKFIGGEWLEEWLGEQIRHLALDPKPMITVGVNARRETQLNARRETQLEIDVAVVRGHRSYFISCTTDTTKAICKSKLFEIAVRSRHLGGDLARAALVCLADDTIVEALQADIDDVWGATNTTCVFGLSDITTWSTCGGKQPNLSSLQTWMES